MKVLFIGDVVASPGRRALSSILPSYLRSNSIDICIANVENSTHGLGVSSKVIDELTSLGVDGFTLGNHSFSNYDFLSSIKKHSNVIRPDNVSSAWPGKGVAIIKKGNLSLGIMNLQGQVNMNPPTDSPFDYCDRCLNYFEQNAIRNVILDFHAEATSEKEAMGFFLDGKVSAIVGTHTHVQTADQRVLANGTGYITDAGMTGCVDSILGMDIETSLSRFTSKIPVKYKPAEGDAFMCGVTIELDDFGKCKRIDRVCEYE